MADLDKIDEKDVEGVTFSAVEEADAAADVPEARLNIPYVLVQNNHSQNSSQNQTVSQSQDQTTVNNIFRESKAKEAPFWKKLLIELLLSVLEPDRFLKNAKAIFIILIGIALFCFIRSLSFDEAEQLLELYLDKAK